MTREMFRGAVTAMKRSGIACGALLVAMTIGRALAVQSTPRLALELQDYAALPITADNTDANTRAQLARVNYLRDEPGGRRFFVNDLNGPLYLLDEGQRSVYLDVKAQFPDFFSGRGMGSGFGFVTFDPEFEEKLRVST